MRRCNSVSRHIYLSSGSGLSGQKARAVLIGGKK